ncbi:peptidase inhibitor family I36 protein [Actinopolyspora mortivallis]|uniref:peptidase inhibitor family I36 protein n=1 Tax=Actinopolyspora mortivallis TaxID=33906 RepID=UPI0015E62206|nr:peptidase inhibitor family I36 protein [Actinopolyspora mortivallis]
MFGSRNEPGLFALVAAAMLASATAAQAAPPDNAVGTRGEGADACPSGVYCLYQWTDFNEKQQEHPRNLWHADGNWQNLNEVPENAVSANDKIRSVVNHTDHDVFVWQDYRGRGNCVVIPPGSRHADLNDYDMAAVASSVTVNPPDIHSCTR